MKKILLVISLFFLVIITNVKATTVNSIKMDVELGSDGTAHITEVWNAYVNKGTEGYHPYFNLGNSKITNYSVSDTSGSYTYVSNWNINASREDKTNKYGIYTSGDETDLCWGIGDYGTHTYTLTYDITNFIYTTTDGYQVLYWTLIPSGLSSSPQNTYIKVYENGINFSNDLPVWGFGNYGGYAYVYNGYIEMSSDGALDNDEYLTLLVKFPAATFSTNNSIDKTFDEIYSMAEEGSTAYDENKINFVELILTIATIVTIIVLTLYIIIIIIKSQFANKIKNKKYPKKDTPMWRNLPTYPISLEYLVANEYRLIKKKEDYLGCILLKWIINNNIKVENKKIFLLNRPTDNIEDGLLYDIMLSVSNENQIVDQSSFKRYCNKNYQEILGWFDKVIKSGYAALKENNLTTENSWKICATPTLNENAAQLQGLKTFFKEFSSLKDKSSIEVHLWRDYLMYAQLFGIANKVAKEFKAIYPNVITEEDYGTFIYINNFSYTIVNTASIARNRAISYSAGGGGFSAGGGGGGSFGGGGSGGGFR